MLARCMKKRHLLRCLFDFFHANWFDKILLSVESRVSNEIKPWDTVNMYAIIHSANFNLTLIHSPIT
ncbi:hypothetical protein J2X61_004743 [Bacillus sp. 3255]|nr:hypothetical protein [Bacillus sp. 3255]